MVNLLIWILWAGLIYCLKFIPHFFSEIAFFNLGHLSLIQAGHLSLIQAGHLALIFTDLDWPPTF